MTTNSFEQLNCLTFANFVASLMIKIEKPREKFKYLRVLGFVVQEQRVHAKRVKMLERVVL